ncbi:MAG: CDP-diacylglycerol--serine O-phosphatidyltransferase [Flavobacteriales bacterium]|nr:CDP-diacylglycerol--serine O-phosphatidyltransferase [Flavobacteriales bacterium]
MNKYKIIIYFGFIMKKNIAHIVTLTSLCISIISIIQSCYFNFIISSYLIFICLLLDNLDGLIARYLNTVSEFGKQLDSFSDMIAFGVAPAVLLYNFIQYQFNNNTLAYITLLIPIFSSIRLANYNSNSTNNPFFHGITTPVNAIFFGSLPLINQYEESTWIVSTLINEAFIAILIIIMSILLITPLKTFNLRIDAIKDDKRKLFFIFISISVLYLFNFTGLPIIIFIYILLNVMRIIN